MKLYINILILFVAVLLGSCGINGHNNFNKQKFTNLSANKSKISTVEIKKDQYADEMESAVNQKPTSIHYKEVEPLSVSSKDETASTIEKKEIIQKELNSQVENTTTPVVFQESSHPKRELIRKINSSNKKRGAGTAAALLIAGIFLLVAGLGFLLIGAILALLSGGLGAIFLIVGGILVVIALIMIIVGASSGS